LPSVNVIIPLGIVRLSHKARLPTNSSAAGAAGLDLYPMETTLIAPLRTKLIHTDQAVHLPLGTFARICNKSKIPFKGVHVVPGIIDNDYTGPIMPIVQVWNEEAYDALMVSHDIPITQIVVQSYISVVLEEHDSIAPLTCYG
jgi:dUTP pyrophosphatase